MWAPQARTRVLVRRGGDPKGGSCIPWKPTSPREAHENVLIRSDLPLISRGLFPTIVCFRGEQNYEGYELQSGHYINKWGGLLHTLSKQIRWVCKILALCSSFLFSFPSTKQHEGWKERWTALTSSCFPLSLPLPIPHTKHCVK